MPTYEYLCPRGHEFEQFQSITAEPIAKCPQCNRKARRQISGGAGLIFKGSGFYITDYKRSSTKAGATRSRDSGSPYTEKSSQDVRKDTGQPKVAAAS